MRNWLSFLGWPILCGILAGLLIAVWPGRNATPGGDSAAPYSYADAVQRASPAVVNIYTAKKVRTPLSALSADPFFRHFLNSSVRGREGTARCREASAPASSFLPTAT